MGCVVHDSDVNTHPDADAYPDAYAYPDADAHSDAYPDAHSDAHSDAYTFSGAGSAVGRRWCGLGYELGKEIS